MTTPQGWYPDTTAPGTERFWDGEAWTEQTRPAPIVTPGTNRNWFVLHKGWTAAGILVLLLAASVAGGRSSSEKHPVALAQPTASASAVIPLDLGTPTPAPQASRRAAESVFLASSAHYRGSLAEGMRIVLSEAPYPNADVGLQKMQDPSSAAARFAAWRQKDDPYTDTSYMQAFSAADAYFTADDEPSNINDWRDAIGNVNGDFFKWESVVADYQISNATRADLSAAVAKIAQDLATADVIARQIGS